MHAHNFYPNFHINISWLRLNVTCPLQDFPSNCLSEESNATNLMLPLWSGLWDSKHWYLHIPVCVWSNKKISPKPGIHTPNCLKKWTEEQEGLAPHLRKPPPSPPPGIKLQPIQCQLDLKWAGQNLYENCTYLQNAESVFRILNLILSALEAALAGQLSREELRKFNRQANMIISNIWDECIIEKYSKTFILTEKNH